MPTPAELRVPHILWSLVIVIVVTVALGLSSSKTFADEPDGLSPPSIPKAPIVTADHEFLGRLVRPKLEWPNFPAEWTDPAATLAFCSATERMQAYTDVISKALSQVSSMGAEFRIYARDVRSLAKEVKAKAEVDAQIGVDAKELAHLVEQYTYLEAEAQWADAVAISAAKLRTQIAALGERVDVAAISACGCPGLSLPLGLIKQISSSGFPIFPSRIFTYTRGTANDGPLFAQVDIRVHPGVGCTPAGDEPGIIFLFGVLGQSDYFSLHAISGNLPTSFYPEQLIVGAKATFDNGKTVEVNNDATYRYVIPIPKGAKALTGLTLKADTGQATTADGGTRVYTQLSWP